MDVFCVQCTGFWMIKVKAMQANTTGHSLSDRQNIVLSYHNPFNIRGERIILHTREGWRNKAVLCAKMASSLMCGNYPYLKLWFSVQWEKFPTLMHSFCGQYYCSDMEHTRILHDTNPWLCNIHSILSPPVADWSKWDLCLIWLSWMYTDPPRTPITNQYHLPLVC